MKQQFNIVDMAGVPKPKNVFARSGTERFFD